jgi:hypothetical protein
MKGVETKMEYFLLDLYKSVLILVQKVFKGVLNLCGSLKLSTKANVKFYLTKQPNYYGQE